MVSKNQVLVSIGFVRLTTILAKRSFDIEPYDSYSHNLIIPCCMSYVSLVYLPYYLLYDFSQDRNNSSIHPTPRVVVTPS